MFDEKCELKKDEEIQIYAKLFFYCWYLYFGIINVSSSLAFSSHIYLFLCARKKAKLIAREFSWIFCLHFDLYFFINAERLFFFFCLFKKKMQICRRDIRIESLSLDNEIIYRLFICVSHTFFVCITTTLLAILFLIVCWVELIKIIFFMWK